MQYNEEKLLYRCGHCDCEVKLPETLPMDHEVRMAELQEKFRRQKMEDEFQMRKKTFRQEAKEIIFGLFLMAAPIIIIWIISLFD